MVQGESVGVEGGGWEAVEIKREVSSLKFRNWEERISEIHDKSGRIWKARLLENDFSKEEARSAQHSIFCSICAESLSNASWDPQ